MRRRRQALGRPALPDGSFQEAEIPPAQLLSSGESDGKGEGWARPVSSFSAQSEGGGVRGLPPRLRLGSRGKCWPWTAPPAPDLRS